MISLENTGRAVIMSSTNFGPYQNGTSPSGQGNRTPNGQPGLNASPTPTGPSGEQYSWASFLPYTIKIGDGMWDTWTLISAGLTVLGFVVPMVNLFLGDLLSALAFVAALLATIQIHRARNAYSPNESNQSVKNRAPRGWVISIVLLIFCGLAAIGFIGNIIIGYYWYY